MDELLMYNSAKQYTPVTSNRVKKFIYENVGEDNCAVANDRGRIDPMLKLYPGAPMMLTLNEDVKNGEANGTRVTFVALRFKTGEAPFKFTLSCGTMINGAFASQLQSIVLEHENPDIEPRIFEVESKNRQFTAQGVYVDGIKENWKMKGTQFPIVSNTCTTGHKLQGCTVKCLLANEWFYGANWVYVVLSRVKTLAGLFVAQELSLDLSKYAKPENMKKMIKGFAESRIAVTYFPDEFYTDLEKDGDVVLQTPGTPGLDDEPDSDEPANVNF